MTATATRDTIDAFTATQSVMRGDGRYDDHAEVQRRAVSSGVALLAAAAERLLTFVTGVARLVSTNHSARRQPRIGRRSSSIERGICVSAVTWSCWCAARMMTATAVAIISRM